MDILLHLIKIFCIFSWLVVVPHILVCVGVFPTEDHIEFEIKRLFSPLGLTTLVLAMSF